MENIRGRILAKGREVALHPVSEMSRLVGLVLQDFEAQLFSTNVELEMAFGPENHCLPRQEIERRIQLYLSFVGLEKLRNREPATLSGGAETKTGYRFSPCIGAQDPCDGRANH